ncbi:MAG TPA: phospholipase D-like domain-containing protein [Gemmatimonadaceae bacterium]|nr:phospholipase D-like domain-containing protein [Gemmatimonadaceae bacterium]
MQSARSYIEMTRLKPFAKTIGIIVVVTLALIGLLSITRGTPLRRVIYGTRPIPPHVSEPSFRDLMALFSGVHLETGNKVEQLLDGDGTYPRLWDDLRRASRTITMQMYFSQPGQVADTLGTILTERARSGVRVLLLLDAFGSQTLRRAWVDSLRRAGVEVAVLRKLKWYSIHNAADRSHVRAVVIDGRIGYTGGFGLADYWLGDGRGADQWRESNVRFEGPAVMELQAAFAAGWVESTGELLVDDRFFPRRGFHVQAGNTTAGLLFTSTTTGSTPAERFLALTIAGSSKTLYVTNSYFVPDDDFRDLLIDAVRRGVDVRILTVSKASDVLTTWFAGRARYESLLSGGVRIFEYQPSMMHAKTMVADGIWGTIGSMNFDNRSLAFNNESNLVVWDRDFGSLMDATYLEDLKLSREIRLPEFRRRSMTERLVELGASVLSRLL